MLLLLAIFAKDVA